MYGLKISCACPTNDKVIHTIKGSTFALNVTEKCNVL